MKRGRPTNRERAQRAFLAAQKAREANPRSRLPKFGPERPVGLGWGGAREGSGRKSKPPAEKAKFAVIRLSAEMETRLGGLPEGTRTEYITKALELMVDLVPPEKFKAAENPDNGTDGTQAMQ